MKYTFQPNDLAKLFFNLSEDAYHFDSITDGLVETLSEEMFEQWMFGDTSSKSGDEIKMSNLSTREQESIFKGDGDLNTFHPIAIGKLICN